MTKPKCSCKTGTLLKTLFVQLPRTARSGIIFIYSYCNSKFWILSFRSASSEKIYWLDISMAKNGQQMSLVAW